MSVYTVRKRSFEIPNFYVFCQDYQIFVYELDRSHQIQVPCFGPGSDFRLFLGRDLRVNIGTFPGGERVLYLWDPADNGFGYAFNLDAPDCSEWGYSPFHRVPDSDVAAAVA